MEPKEIAMKTFVLCKLAPGKEQKAVSAIRAIEGVAEVYMVFGGWDMILSAEADTMDKLSNMIVSRVRAIDGVSATETLVTTNL
jgi:DNA-binding Lrp family transcriptional regulator